MKRGTGRSGEGTGRSGEGMEQGALIALMS